MGWIISGVVVTLVGVGLTVHGMLRTWDRFHSSRRALWDQMLAPWRKLFGAIGQRAGRAFKWRKPRTLRVNAESAMAMADVFTPAVREGRPPGTREQRDAWVDKKLRELEDEIRATAVAGKAADTAQQREYEKDIRDAATADLPKQFLAQVLIAVGVVLMAVPALC